jgi:hypothetical protein
MARLNTTNSHCGSLVTLLGKQLQRQIVTVTRPRQSDLVGAQTETEALIDETSFIIM